VLPLYTEERFIYFSQQATGIIESAVYKKLIAPFKNDLPASHMDVSRRVCADHRYPYDGPDLLSKIYSMTLLYQLMPLPETSHLGTGTIIISKNNSYKGPPTRGETI